MRSHVCPECGADRWPRGPCPRCGALPDLEVETIGEVETGDTVSVRSGGGPRRVIAIVAAFGLVALVLGWMVGGDGAEDQAGEDQAGEERAAEDTVPAEPPEGFAAVPGFEDLSLLRVRARDGEVVEVPLSGTTPPATVVAPRGRSRPPDADPVVIDDMLIDPFGAVSLLDSTEWNASMGPPHDGLLTPLTAWATGSGTVVMPAGRSFEERTPDGEVTAARASPFAGVVGGRAVGVTGRQLIFESTNGIYRFDLDTEEVARVGHGRVLAIGSSLVAVDVCDRQLTCRVELMRVVEGSVVAMLPAELRIHQAIDELRVEPSFSPDGSRLVAATGRQLVIFDVSTGGGRMIPGLDVYAADEAGEGAGAGTVSVLWAPDGGHGLVIVHRTLGPIGELGVTDVVSFDRELERVVRHDGLRAVLDGTVTPGEAVTFALAPPLEPASSG